MEVELHLLRWLLSPDIWLSKTGERNISADDVHIYGTTLLTFTLNIPDSTPAGDWDLNVRSKDGQNGANLGTFTITYLAPSTLAWDWADQTQGWTGWQNSTTCSGSATAACTAYGPVLENGYGVYGSKLTEASGSSTRSTVTKTFTAASGEKWSSITFSGLLSPSDDSYSRSMTINVNNVDVYTQTAEDDPAINGQQFTITKTFTPSSLS